MLFKHKKVNILEEIKVKSINSDRWGKAKILGALRANHC